MNYVFWLLGLGVVGFFVGLLTRGFGIISLASAIVVTISVLLFAYIMLRTVTGKLKVDTRVISTETKFFEAALIYLVLVTFIGVTMLLNPGLVKGIFFAHAHLALLGWVSITIFGGMYHVIPMLAWAGMMEKKVQPLPTTFKELYSERLSRVIFWLSNIGLVGLLAGSFLSPRLATISGTLFTIAAFIFSYEMLNIIRKG
jgi:cbb3-type cytochrome oxidase subunit 1